MARQKWSGIRISYLGEQRGIDKGRNEGKLEVARTMLQNGIDHNTVMKRPV